MKKRIFRWLSILFVVLLVLLVGLVVFSPYGKSTRYSHKAVECSIIVDASPKDVYSVLGNSDNARLWSVFVHHITTLNSEEIPDGGIGSVRRCFENEEETGLMWDEETIINIPAKQRRLTIYNMKGFDMTADQLRTDQLYEPLDENKTRLTFTLFFEPEKKIGFMDHLKLYYSAFQVKTIFEENLTNIRYLVEEGNNYERRYPFIGLN